MSEHLAKRNAHVVASLLWDHRCAGCGLWDCPLCDECQHSVGTALVDVSGLAPSLHADVPVWALGEYGGPMRSMVVAWKNGARWDAGSFLTERLCQAVSARSFTALFPRAFSSCDRVAVIPAPSSFRRSWRGLFVVGDVADALATAIFSLVDVPGCYVCSAGCLRRRGGPVHQRGGNVRQRRRNRAHRVVSLTDLTGWDVVLCDDVLTTGATIQACVDAVQNAGGRLIGAVCVAYTPPVRSEHHQ